VYLDALLPQSGQSPFDRLPPAVAAARRELAQSFSGGLSIPVPDPTAFDVTDPADVAWLKARCTPHPLSAYESSLVLKHPLGNGLPATYVACKPDYGPTASSREHARSLSDWHYVEVDGGHDVMVTNPQGVLDIISPL
jgi:hypothetical protein